MTHDAAFLGIITTVILALPVSGGERLDVKIIDRQDGQTGYSYVVPGYWNATSSTRLDCYGSPNSVGCNGTTNTTRTSTPPRRIAYSVVGATLTLLLPDGRVAVVNCVSKYRPRGDYINKRSCRIPLVPDIKAEFSGNGAKLQWSVSLDGKKTESETYKILGVLEKPSK